jgi:predicted deacylase
MISIGDLTASSGQKISGNVPIHVPEDRSTGIYTCSTCSNATIESNIPITIVNGILDGPTVLVLSGIHGSEYVPIMATQRLAKDLDPSALQGSVILVHIANLPAYLGRTVYTSPADGKNLNRVFPGNPNGTLSERIANFLVQDVYPVANYVLDMHSGDANEQLGPSYTAYYGKAGSPEVIQASKSMAIAFGLDLMVEFQWELLGNNNNNNNTSKAIWAGSAAVVRGIPSIDVEIAPGMGTSHSDSIDQAYKGVMRVMVYLGMLPRKAITITIPDTSTRTVSGIDKDNVEEHKNHKPCLVKERHFIEAPLKGSWVPLVDTGTFVARGTSLGYMTDFYGRRKIFEAPAPSNGLLLIRYESPPVLEGDTLAVIAVLNASDPACERLKRDGLLDKHEHEHALSNNLVLWQWAAATGWLVALGLGLGTFIGKRRRRKSGSYQHAHVSIGEEGTMDMDARVV